jgi:hypothetical protein
MGKRKAEKPGSSVSAIELTEGIQARMAGNDEDPAAVAEQREQEWLDRPSVAEVTPEERGESLFDTEEERQRELERLIKEQREDVKQDLVPIRKGLPARRRS